MELSRLLEPSSLEAEDFAWAATTACTMGVRERCRALALTIRAEDPERAASLLRLGCGYDDTASLVPPADAPRCFLLCCIFFLAGCRRFVSLPVLKRPPQKHFPRPLFRRHDRDEVTTCFLSV